MAKRWLTASACTTDPPHRGRGLADLHRTRDGGTIDAPPADHEEPTGGGPALQRTPHPDRAVGQSERLGPHRRRSSSKEVRSVGEHISLTVNGERHELDVEPRRLLVQAVREDLDLTGTHVGCDTSQCGACTVHLGGRR